MFNNYPGNFNLPLQYEGVFKKLFYFSYFFNYWDIFYHRQKTSVECGFFIPILS